MFFFLFFSFESWLFLLCAAVIHLVNKYDSLGQRQTVPAFGRLIERGEERFNKEGGNSVEVTGIKKRLGPDWGEISFVSLSSPRDRTFVCRKP